MGRGPWMLAFSRKRKMVRSEGSLSGGGGGNNIAGFRANPFGALAELTEDEYVAQGLLEDGSNGRKGQNLGVEEQKGIRSKQVGEGPSKAYNKVWVEKPESSKSKVKRADGNSENNREMGDIAGPRAEAAGNKREQQQDADHGRIKLISSTLDPNRHMAVRVDIREPQTEQAKQPVRQKDIPSILHRSGGGGRPPDKRTFVNIRSKVKTKAPKSKQSKVLASEMEESDTAGTVENSLCNLNVERRPNQWEEGVEDVQGTANPL